jgi:ABC-type cobalamin/Fe3+-siderophores transport system ATPase subunit
MLKITIKNYRNISAGQPLELQIGDGITFILGVNNAGKSNLLRLFFELRPIFAAYEKENGTGQRQANIHTHFDSILRQGAQNEVISLVLENAAGKHELTIRAQGEIHSQSVTVTAQTVSGGREPFIKLMAQLSRALLIGPVRSQMAQASYHLNDLVSGHSFINQWHEWANGDHVKHREQIRLLVGELRELFGFNRFDIRVSKQGNSLLVTTDDGDFQLQELGDGISHFIVVLGNVLFKKPSLVLIDEPENGLHPKMQELFIRSLASKCEFGLVATSHAVGLARSVADQLLVITRTPNGPKISLFGDHDSTTILQSISELGYSQFAQLGGNHLLLVEGRTEIKSFREILRKYGIEHHFIIWSLGGAEFINGDAAKITDELNELKRLNAKSVSVIFDSERAAPAAILDQRFQGFEKICSSLGFNVFATDRHSTENYIVQDAINKVVGNGFKALQPHEKFGAANQKWHKAQNWKMFREMKKEDFSGTKLDEFITNTLVPLTKQS